MGHISYSSRATAGRRWLPARGRACCAVFASAGALLCSGPIAAPPQQAPRQARETAVIEARAGRAAQGLETLRQLLQRYPDDPRLLADTVAVANWAGDDALALQLYDLAATPKDDAGTAEAAARSARNLRQYRRALQLFDRAGALQPERWQGCLGEILVLADLGDFPRAAPLAATLLARHGDEREVLLGVAYFRRQSGDYSGALALYERRLDRAPDDLYAQQQFAETLAQAGGAFQAEGADARVQGVDSRLQLNIDTAAEQIRWGDAYAPTAAQQREESRAALARLDALLAACSGDAAIWRQMNQAIAAGEPAGGVWGHLDTNLSSCQTGSAVWLQAQADRIVALHQLKRMSEVVRTYEQLRQQGVELPPYALRPVADAYLAVRRPEQAEPLFRRLIATDPGADKAPLQTGLAYAQLEQEHVGEAVATADAALAASPALLAAGRNEAEPNREYGDLALQAARMHGFADQLAEARRRLEDLVAQAPANRGFRRELAMLYLRQGWIERARQQIRIATTHDPDDQELAIAQAQVDQDAGRRDAVDAALPGLQARNPDDEDLAKLARERRLQQGWQLEVEGNGSFGGGSTTGSDDRHEDATIESPQFDNRWRGFVHVLDDGAEFPQGAVSRTRVGGGAQYDYARQQAWAEVDHDTFNGREGGVLGARLTLDDAWSVKAQADTDSYDVPLKALLADVYGRSYSLQLNWQRDESDEARVGLEHIDFSDGNRRNLLSAGWKQRLYTQPHFKADGGIDLSASQNSLPDRIYYNPRDDASAMPHVVFDWLSYCRYEREFHQYLSLSAGPYWERDYGTGLSYSLRYGQRLRWSDALSMLWGISYASQPYDGVTEHLLTLDWGLTWGNP